MLFESLFYYLLCNCLNFVMLLDNCSRNIAEGLIWQCEKVFCQSNELLTEHLWKWNTIYLRQIIDINENLFDCL
jgi:hypothetical protein